MQKIILIILLGFLNLSAQDLDSVRIYINPGHGGYDSNDRYIPETGFWESEGNLIKGLKLRDILQNVHALIQMSRTQNRTVDDKALSVIVAEANAFQADYFHAIHSNGYNGMSNYTLMLFQGFDNGPTYPDARIMGAIMGEEIFKAHRTTTWYNRGDFDFYGTGAPYLGVFKGLAMAGTLSEGSFHDYIPESWRLLNPDYCAHEAWAIARSFLEFFDAGAFGVGEIAGVVRDIERIPAYFYIPSTGDGKAPVNSIRVTLMPGSRVYNGDLNNNGFFLFDSVAPGNYNVIFEASGYSKDSTEVTVAANMTSFADAYLTAFSPDVPTDIRVLGNGSNSLKVVCSDAPRASEYRVLYGTDSQALTDSASSQTAEIILNGLENNRVYYLRVRALNSSGLSALTRDLFAGVPSETDPEILIVNGFDRSTNTRYDYIREYADPVNELGYAFSYTLNECVESGAVNLSPFKTVIWILGDESTLNTTFSYTEQQFIISYLKFGGNLFVSGSEIGWDLGRPGSSSETDLDFYQNYLKAEYLSDAPLDQAGVYYSAEPLNGSIFTGLSAIDFDNGTHGTIDVDWPDAIRAVNGAVDVLKFTGVDESDGVAGIAFEGKFPGGRIPARLVYLTFPFETVYAAEQRTELIDRVLQFFAGQLEPLALQSDAGRSLLTFDLKQNYPNPFNPTTTISFDLPKQAQVKLKVYDALGRLVGTFIDTQMKAGNHKYLFDGSNLASGTYYYKMTVDTRVVTGKMMLIK